MKQLQYLISKQRYTDASALAIYTKQTYLARALFARDTNNNIEKIDAFENLLLADAKEDFDVYNRYLDYRQPLRRNLYLDRRKYLKVIADAVTNMYFPKEGEEPLEVLRIKLRTRSAKSEFFNRAGFWVQGNFPYGETLHCVGGGKLRDGIHAKREAFIDEYWKRHTDVFPDCKVVKKLKLQAGIWLKESEYADISTVTVGGSIEGHVQCTNMLVLDDLVGSDEINSARRLEEIYSSDILNAIMRRYISGGMILIGTPIPTLTGVEEPLDRFYTNRQLAGFKCKEFSVPSLDENLESNYAYREWVNEKPVWRFDTKFMLRERKTAYASENDLEIATYETIYQMKPMQLGQNMFSKLKRYDYEKTGPYREINVFDPADSGADAAVLMHLRIYRDEPDIAYVHDIFRDKRPMDYQQNGGYLHSLAAFIMRNDIHFLYYESNYGGTLLGEVLVELCEQLGYKLRYQDYKQSQNKVQRILDHAVAVLNKVKVREVAPTKQYEEGIFGIMNWTEKAKHDDDIDCLTKAVEIMISGIAKPNTIYIPSKRIL